MESGGLVSGAGPLDGLLVVALEQAVAVPFATRQLADLGARVIKIERAGAGDFARGYDTTVLGQASYFVWLNRGKESVELDVKSDDGRAVMAALLARADVFVQNLAPGAAERLGLDAAGLLARHQRLICCSVSGYGPDGPYAAKKAYDLLVQCEAGLLSVTGTPDVPCKAGISVADIAAGMYAYTGVLTALYERERTGRGSGFAVSLLDALGEWMSQPYLYTVYGGREPRRTGARHASISPYGPYQARGGEVFIGLQNEREWVVLCERVLGRPEMTADEMNRLCARCHGKASIDPAHDVLARFQPWSLERSRCFIESKGRLSCATCHDPHDNARTDAGFYEARCISCHSPAGRAGKLASRLCPVNRSSGCVSCHMPKDDRGMLHVTLPEVASAPA